jgi:hypothetical protein
MHLLRMQENIYSRTRKRRVIELSSWRLRILFRRRRRRFNDNIIIGENSINFSRALFYLRWKRAIFLMESRQIF